VKTRLHRARNLLRDNVECKIGPVVMEAFPFAGRRCERLIEAVLTRLALQLPRFLLRHFLSGIFRPSSLPGR
jgi:hypothetical protein